MYKNKPCTLIDVDEAKKIVRIKIMWIMCNSPRLEVIPNRVLQIMKIFWNQGVCQDREDKIKLQLKESDIPFYDPYLIVKKSRGECRRSIIK